jgi:homoserine O-acetyltransferase
LSSLYGPDQPLDLRKYYLVLPDCLGHGKSSKPSDGLRAHFPKYGYEDMVLAEYRLVTEALGIQHLRLITGDSMGGMHTWLWLQAGRELQKVALFTEDWNRLQRQSPKNRT